MKKKPVLSPIQFSVSKKQRKAKIKEAIAMLNEIVKIKVAPSEVHGVGVVAMRNIKKGERLNADAISQKLDIPYSDFKHLDPEISEYILGRWPQVVNGSIFLYPDTRFQAFINHSDTPNYDGKEDKALRAIKKGEELTEDYRLIPNYEQIYSFLKTTPQKKRKS